VLSFDYSKRKGTGLKGNFVPVTGFVGRTAGGTDCHSWTTGHRTPRNRF